MFLNLAALFQPGVFGSCRLGSPRSQSELPGKSAVFKAFPLLGASLLKKPAELLYFAFFFMVILCVSTHSTP